MHTSLLQRQREEGELRNTTTQIDDLLKQAIDTSRTLTVELSPAVLHEAGLVAGLRWLERTCEEKYGLAVELQADNEMKVNNEDVRVFVFEAVREMLLNVVKHAGVNRATVHVGIDESNCLVTRVADRGSGFRDGDRPDNLAGFGLFGIRQRAESLGGSFSIETAPALCPGGVSPSGRCPAPDPGRLGKPVDLVDDMDKMD